ncbi:MAG: 2-oxoacid:acceptor oxidoreductase subunit alpha [Bacteriovoracaceae bacterium]|nr:2-oxoacid:acceptor oxidoreductase subunit alpha [Bacteriovoracaceae bacterium]
MQEQQPQEVENIVIRFSGDSGDGMQVTGGQFSATSALMGNDISTFPDFPAEIRAPQGTVAGISGFQINFGSNEINTPGDQPDILIAMNPAALKANLEDLKRGGVIIVNEDAFTALNFKKAGLEDNPLEWKELESYQLIKVPITSQTKEALSEIDLDTKSKTRSKNFYALGMTYFMYHRDLEPTIRWIEHKFKGKDAVIEANITALKAGYNFADTVELIGHRYKVKPASIEKGSYRQINGNTATAWGFIWAAENAGINLFLGSYPITPASDVLHELSKHKNHGVITFQAEDEIAAVCSSIGASFGGALGITTSSGPGIALKSEAINLAVVLELPLVVVDIQRGGPSTGLPTKTEQSDLNMAMYGRNGESPMILVAAKSPSDCFNMAYEASRLSLEHMTPAMLLTDGFIANGSEPWKIPDVRAEFPAIKTKLANPEDYKDKEFLPYDRDPKTLARMWAVPGMPDLMHRVGGLEKEDKTGNVSYDPANHELMVQTRQEKVDRIADFIPEQDVLGDKEGDLLIVSWGGTYGATYQAVSQMRERGANVSLMHMRYLNPMPKNVESIIKGFKKTVVAELNGGQLKGILNSKYNCNASGYNKIQGKPFMIRELTQMIEKELEQL